MPTDLPAVECLERFNRCLDARRVDEVSGIDRVDQLVEIVSLSAQFLKESRVGNGGDSNLAAVHFDADEFRER